MARISATRRFRSLFSILEKEFGVREAYKPHPPVEQALVTLLLRHGKEDAAGRAIKRLSRVFVGWNEARVCDAEELDEILGRNFPPGVGELIRNALTAIFNHAQAMSLDDVMELGAERAEAKLRGMRLMPSRVVGELLLASLGCGKLPQGAGMLRVARRTHIVGKGSADAQMKRVRRLTPKTMIPRVFHAFEMLAERVCKVDNCDCRACPVRELCPTGIEKLKRLKVQEEKELAARRVEARSRRRKRDRARKAKARKKAATAKLKEAIQDRSKKLKLSPSAKRRRRAGGGPIVSATAKMVQASSAEVKPSQKKKGRRRARRPGAGRKS